MVSLGGGAPCLAWAVSLTALARLWPRRRWRSCTRCSCCWYQSRPRAIICRPCSSTSFSCSSSAICFSCHAGAHTGQSVHTRGAAHTNAPGTPYTWTLPGKGHSLVSALGRPRIAPQQEQMGGALMGDGGTQPSTQASPGNGATVRSSAPPPEASGEHTLVAGPAQKRGAWGPGQGRTAVERGQAYCHGTPRPHLPEGFLP